MDEIYYDPLTKEYYEQNGNLNDPHRFFSAGWFRTAEFITLTGQRLILPEQESSWGRQKDEQPEAIRTSDVVNFVEIGIMAMCAQTDMSGAHPSTCWENQRPCTFSIRSICNNRCMFWDIDLDGHCDSIDAYQHRQGQSIDLEKIQKIRKKDDMKNLPSDHHFKEAKSADSEILSNWYSEGRLERIRDASNGVDSIFYDPQWDVFWNGVCDFLEEITKKKRRTGRDAEEIVQNWIGDVGMQKYDEKCMEGVGVGAPFKFRKAPAFIVNKNPSIASTFVDTSGSISKENFEDITGRITRACNDIKDRENPCNDCALRIDNCHYVCLKKMLHNK
jgi:hypothetical protein